MNLEMRLTPDVLFMIVDLHTILSCEEKMFDWLLRKNPKLDKRGDGVTPLMLINRGQISKVIKFVQSCTHEEDL